MLSTGHHAYSQQIINQQASEAANRDALRRIWIDQGAKWEINSLKHASEPGKSAKANETNDSIHTLRWIGYDHTGHPIYYLTSNLYAAGSLNTNRLWTGGSSDLNLEGEGITLNVWDAGLLRHAHREYENRTIQMDDAPSIHAHATHVSGTMVAAGITPAARGMAPRARLHAYDFINDEPEMAQAALDGAILSNHSYGRPTGWLFNQNQWWWYGDTRVSSSVDYKFGYYDQETRTRDEISYHAPFYLQVHAAGNDRNDQGPAAGSEHNVWNHQLNQWVKSTDYREPDGGLFGFDCLSSLVIGKNVITVGSVQDVLEYTGPESVLLSEFSSTGPTDDGRIKPDLVANGQSVLSTWVDNNASYAILSGTSMAAPSITGSLGLLQELHKRLFGTILRSATIKALAIHSAREAGLHPGPDYRHGWGLADMEAAARLIAGKDNITRIHEGNLIQNTVPKYTRNVYSTGQKPLIATLAWTDVPGTPLSPSLNNRTPLLVNDLDLRIIRITDNEVFYPWKLNPDNPSAAATKGDNLVDNVEKIEILLPEPGMYRVEVSHKGTIIDPVNETNKRQAFSLVISGIAERNIDLAVTNILVLTSGCEYGTQTPVRATIENNGRNLAESFVFNFIVKNAQGQQTDSGSLNLGPLEAGKSLDVDFFADLSDGFQFELTGTVQIAGDQLPSNNSFVRQISSSTWVVRDTNYQTSFEGISQLSEIGWREINANQDNAGWMIRVASSASQWASDGFNSVRYGIYNPTADGTVVTQKADDYLVSTCFYLYKGENYRLSFDYRSWNNQDAESMRVLLGSSADSQGLGTVLLDMPGFTTEGYQNSKIALSVPEDGTYYLAFHVYSNANHGFVYLDNVSLEQMVIDDVMPTELMVEADGCGFSAQTPVKARIFNAGENSQQGFDVKLQVLHQQSQTMREYTHTFNQEIEPDAYATIDFLADMNLNGIYKLSLITLLAGDERPENDTIRSTVVNAGVDLDEASFFTNLDDISSFNDIAWQVINVDNNLNVWRFYRTAGQANTPPNSINYYRSNPTQKVNDWLITNCLKITEGNHYRISFNTALQGTSVRELFKLYLLNGTTPNDTIQFIAEVEILSYDYRRDEYTFRAPGSGTYYLGFYCDYQDPEALQLFIDDVLIEAVPMVDAAVTGIEQKVWGCQSMTAKSPIEVTIKNRGTSPLVNPMIALKTAYNGEEANVYTMETAVTLELDQEHTMVFEVDLSRLNTLYTVTAEISLAQDADPANNALSIPVRNTTVDLTTGETYFNDFELGYIDGNNGPVDPTTGWASENTNNDFHDDGTPISWAMRRNVGFARSGQISMRSGRSTEQAANDWLFSNCLYMKAGEHYLLSFYYTGRQSNREETMAVYLGSAQSSSAMTRKLWQKTFNTAIQYKEAVIAFTPEEDGYYYIGFHAISEADQGWIYLDDFSIRKNHDTDLSLDDIEVMAAPCDFSEQTPVRLSMRNSGNKAINTPIFIHYSITDPLGETSSEITVEVDQALMPGETTHLTIEANFSQFGIYTILAHLSLGVDIEEPETGNNSLSAKVFSTSMNPGAGQIYLTFEEFRDLSETGWTALDLNEDGISWDFRSATAYAFSGSRVFLYGFSNESQANDWLFSDCARLKAGVVYKVGFSYRVFDGDYNEHIDFGIASAIDPSAVISILESKEDYNNYNYRRASYAFTVPQDGNYYFAWHARSPAMRRYFFMDDFSLEKAVGIDGSIHDVSIETTACQVDDETPVLFTLTNLGSENLPAGQLEIQISGPGNTQSLVASTPQLQTGEKADIRIKANMTKYGRYVFNYNLQIPGDLDVTNNQGSRTIYNHRINLAAPGSSFVQDFEQIFALREAGWSIHNLNEDNRYWGLRQNDASNAFRGRNYLIYFMGSSGLPANDWVISGCYGLDGGRKYKIAMHYKLGSGEHNLLLAAGNQPLPEAMNLSLWEGNGLRAPEPNAFTRIEHVFEAPSSGEFYFGIKQQSIPAQGSSIIDYLVVIAKPDIIPLGSPVGFGQTVTLQALASDSLVWFSDEALTQELGRGKELSLTIGQTSHFTIYAAERISGITGPADATTILLNTSTEDIRNESALVLYPNPARNVLQLEIREPITGIVFIEIYNLMGERMIQTTTQEAFSTISLDKLTPGTYFLRVTSGNSRFTERFMVVQ